MTGVTLYLTGTDLKTGWNLLLLVANVFLVTFHVQMGRHQPLHANVSLYIPGFPSSFVAAGWEFTSSGDQDVRAALTSTKGNMPGSGIGLSSHQVPTGNQSYNPDAFDGPVHPSHG